MGVTFTPDQQKVIDLRNRNILVSAAAGSGKTAVLVERIITRLTKDASPIDVDQLLIVTFTEAAAAEMKERIRNAIEKALEAEPENAHLQRQSSLIHNAPITTIHSFCLSVIREYFHTIDLDPSFRIGEEGELKLLKRDVLEDVLEKWYQESSPEFIQFLESIATGKDDRKIEEVILQLYDYSRSYPNPEKWLKHCVDNYAIESEKEFEQSAFAKKILTYVQHILSDVEANLQCARAICLEEDGPRAYEETIESDLLLVKKIGETNSYHGKQQIFASMKLASLKANRDKSVDEEKIAQVKLLRDECKKAIEELKEDYFFDSVEAILCGMHAAKSNVAVLVDIVKEFAQEFSKKKQEKNIIDFNDMEHLALRILTIEEDGKLIPSTVAKEYQERFAEVMIDEYQDSNYIQESILTSVSTVSKGQPNIFMVGDVKQSIYRFRLSRPELFMEKYDSYSTEDAKKQRVDLSKNFRSRREVLESTNFIFKQIMMKAFGGIAYDDKAALYVGASYEDMPNNETEICLVDAADFPNGENKRELEALAVASKIKALVNTHQILDKKTGEYRKAGYRDIVVLTRSLKGWTDVFLKVFKQEDIPAYSASREGYFQTREIQMLLDYLRVLDNPLQDIPFVSTLTSPFARISDEELAQIKSEREEKYFYQKVISYVEHGKNDALRKKLGVFVNQYDEFRSLVPYMGIHTLLFKIMEETGYRNYIAAMPSGEQREANLEMLIEKAVAFESTSYKGLFHFVRYIEQLQKYDVDYGEANIVDEGSDVVRIMSIHKSKGLEFPIVFVVGMNKAFNLQETRNSVVLHSELGAGVDFVDIEKRVKYPSLLKKMIQNEIEKESVAEELRVLYVAMTRAKEKLILSGVVSNLESVLRKYCNLDNCVELHLPYTRVVKARKYLDWILPALYRNKAFDVVRDAYKISGCAWNPLYQMEVPVKVDLIEFSDLLEEQKNELLKEYLTKEILERWDTGKVYDLEMKGQLENQFGFAYTYMTASEMKPKMSVSELKKKAYMEEDESKEEEVYPLLPKFMQETTGFDGAARGTAYHRVMELLDFQKDYSLDALEKDIQKMVSEKMLSKEEAEAVNRQDVLLFLTSSVGKRVKEASRAGKMRTEQPFVLGEQVEGEMVLIQGIIDVFFEEDGELVVLDYKTDRVQKASELVDRYRVQLEYYAKALENVTQKKVKEKIIYSFTLQEEILCEPLG